VSALVVQERGLAEHCAIPNHMENIYGSHLRREQIDHAHLSHVTGSLFLLLLTEQLDRAGFFKFRAFFSFFLFFFPFGQEVGRTRTATQKNGSKNEM
jgi:hypothetical protein